MQIFAGAGTGNGGRLVILEEIRGEGKEDDEQVVLEDGHGGLPHHLVHHTLGGVLAKQETLEGDLGTI